MKRKGGLFLGSLTGMQGSVEKFKSGHYTRFLWLFCTDVAAVVSQKPLWAVFFQRHEAAKKVALFPDTGICKWNQVVNAFCFLKKKVEKSKGARQQKMRKSHCVFLAVIRVLYDVKQYPLIESEQRLRLLLMISTGYLNV